MTFYWRTNENLNAIIAGLDLAPDDTVLATGGSGDQAFAMLEFAGRVKAVDSNPAQIAYIKERAEALQRGDYTAFLRERVEERCPYFLEDENRVERIREKLENLTVAEPGDIIGLPQEEQGYSKIYLSNIIGYRERLRNIYPNVNKIRRKLQTVAQKLAVRGLIYVSNHSTFAKVANESGIRLYEEDLSIVHFLPPELELSPVLSSKAREHEKSWNPAVYRRVELQN